MDRDPHVVAPAPPRDGSGNGAGAAVAGGGERVIGARPPPRRAHRRRPTAAERMRIESVWLAYGENWVVRDVSLPVRQGEVLALIGASGSGKTTLLRSLNRLTEITAGRGARRADHARRRGDPRARGQRAAPARVDGLPAAEPVPDEHLRERRLRAGRALPAGARRGAARRSWSRAVREALRRAGLLRGGRRGPRPLGADTLRRPAAAAVHRARARGRPGGAAARRAVLGARPDLHGDDRGADRRACARAWRS